MTMHGDGGRTQKKQPLEIFSLQPVLGLDTASHRMGMCRCETSAAYGGGDWCDPASQHLNSKHSTYLTHFLVFAFPSKAYLEFPNILTGLLKEVMDNFASACEKGIVTQSGDTWYPACVGFKLDMEWMVKVGSLTRSYQNVGHVNQKPCCHECDAGKQLIPFEDVTDCACWIRTRWATVPWQTMPPWASIPFDSGKPAKILRRDAFHVFRLGICRNFIGSTVHLLIYMGCFNEAGDNGQAACLARAFANLNLFCSANNMKIYSIRGFTVANMHAARNAFPWLGCKGADSITILKWIRFYAGLQLQQNGWSLTEKKVLEWMGSMDTGSGWGHLVCPIAVVLFKGLETAMHTSLIIV
ncbi:unnamed protein product [Cladocopium goreaui]|uniref:Uncharacterized protein n=1 Tax=Cladocopium goreaui TaxID=2562237 RepID=A0A9P1BSS7_9DINO|nr:unnamed protein product [Cladocopium goreaui]CAI3997298.1 unnamed protein product [Cladocopium goreaui]CAI4013631.1 unnamed protein product [Cladocopium goreaui]